MNRKGITLIELLIVVVIVGVLAAIAIPLYNGYMERARRVDAKTALEQLRASQEMRRAERGRYSTDLTELRNTWGAPVATAGDYTVTMVATSTTFTGTATPNTSRQSSDGWLSINHLGEKKDEAGKVYPDPQCKWTR
jgi:type IV pilus assembly protein PilE